MEARPATHGQWPAFGLSYPGDNHGAGPSNYQNRPPSRGRGGRGRGHSGRGGGGRGSRGDGNPYGHASQREDGSAGQLACGFVFDEAIGSVCLFKTNSSLTLTLHRADRHLIYPPGGKEALDRMDPLLIEERKESQRRQKRQDGSRQTGKRPDEDVEAAVMNTIPGLNIALSTPELIQQWIAERKKRWPSEKVVQKKIEEAWDDASRGQLFRSKRTAPQVEDSSQSKRPRPVPKQDGSNSSEDEDSEGSSSSDSDSDASDAPSEEPIKRPHVEAATGEPTGTSIDGTKTGLQSRDHRNLCRFFLQGRCNYGASCKQSHQEPSPDQNDLSKRDDVPNAIHSKATPASSVPSNRRPRPRPPPPNPFEPRNLLHALLRNEIAQHVSSIAQVVRFLVRNDFLQDVELQAGDADKQAQRRALIHVMPATANAANDSNLENNEEKTLKEPEGLQIPLEDGAYPTVPSSQTADRTSLNSSQAEARALYRPPSPTLRPLTSLNWPPEPDPLIFLDPLRRDDPKPLTRQQFEALVGDAELRQLLRPGNEPTVRPSLKRALITLDSLPSDEHRRAALELILGVSLQTPLHPHQVGNTFVAPSSSMNAGGGGGGGSGRFIGEVELFRLGLRVGPTEQMELRSLAKRVSEVVEGSPEFDVEPQGWDDNDEGRSFREEKRRRYWEREADRRDMLRKLGLDVD